MMVYVTVGSTGFDALVHAVCQPDFLQALSTRGFQKLTIQYGTSIEKFQPPRRVNENWGITIDSFDYTNEPQTYMERADLIICHGGTGSILEALHNGRQTIVVPNDLLMEGHQKEIANELEDSGYILVCKPDKLAHCVLYGRFNSLLTYPPADPRPIGEILDEETL